MAIYPVIMCGGAGTRLWPASRPSRPKQFLNLTGPQSLFQDTALRVAPLARDGGSLVIVCGLGHRDTVLEQLADIGLAAIVLLEPEARDSAPAMAAAAAWIVRTDPEGVAVYVASDHHLPDADAFCAAAFEAAAAALDQPRILTLGVRPTAPSSAYGYIHAAGPGLSPVAAFVEKPTRDKAEAFITAGYLWNSGNFVVHARTLLDELARYAPQVAEAAQAAVATAEGGSVLTLGDAFRTAPRISIDYALMEKTAAAWVLPVTFAWSDLGAWDAVAATGTGGQGLSIHEGDGSTYVRAADGMVVATVGVRDIAVIAEHDAVLVCDLASSQNVKALVDRLRTLAPGFLVHASIPPSVGSGADALNSWLTMSALPLWTSVGLDDHGRFAEVLDAEGRDSSGFRRARVPARQIYMLSVAGRMCWPGRWRSALELGLDRYWAEFSRPEGDVRAKVARDGAPLDDDPYLYDQAFALLALASAAQTGVQVQTCSSRADRLRRRLEDRRLSVGGWRETGDRPYQSNAHMHLLEACLAWESLQPNGPWSTMADEIVDLATSRFIDPDTGALREFFNETWTGPPKGEGHLVEPGHQFEWAWLLVRHGRARSVPASLAAARRLYGCGVKGVVPDREVACDELNADLSIRSARARLWPQTEWLKAALILAEAVPDHPAYRRDAARARKALAGYLLTDGRWRDKQSTDGSFVDEPAPASSFYHIMAALDQLAIDS